MRNRSASVVNTGDAWILGKVAKPTLTHDLAGDGFSLATENFEQRRLSRSVTTNESNLVLGHDGERGVLDNETTTNLDRKRLDLKHPSSVLVQNALRNHRDRYPSFILLIISLVEKWWSAQML